MGMNDQLNRPPLKTQVKGLKRNQSTISCYFPLAPSNKPAIKKHRGNDSVAQAPSRILDSEVHNLTENGESWYILTKSWLPPPSNKEFEKEWSLHPDNRHSLKV